MAKRSVRCGTAFGAEIRWCGRTLKKHAWCRPSFEDSIVKHFKLTLIASLEHGKPWSGRRLDELEGDSQKRLMCMGYNGGE